MPETFYWQCYKCLHFNSFPFEEGTLAPDLRDKMIEHHKKVSPACRGISGLDLLSVPKEKVEERNLNDWALKELAKLES